ncbi:MAG: ribonuclease III [Chitinophagales bacterium]|nr:ribonuclease III [Chitinophagales bacterium]
MINWIKRFFRSRSYYNKDYKYYKLYEKIGVFPKHDEKVYIRALTHSSFTRKTSERNERLEFLGDAVLGMVIAEFIFHLLQEENEGLLTKIRSNLVNRKKLNAIGFELKLHQHLRSSLKKHQFKQSPDILGNAFEALIGAYYLDHGIDAVKQIAQKFLITSFDFDNYDSMIFDTKSFLLEWCQSEKKQIQFIHIANDGTIEYFNVDLLIDNEKVCNGNGKSKKDAEFDACKKAIELLNINA